VSFQRKKYFSSPNIFKFITVKSQILRHKNLQMKNSIYTFCVIALLLFSSFRPNLDCEYASSNMGFAKSQINEALQTDDINQARFFTYKAVNAIEKSKNKLVKCGCTYAKTSMKESLDLLLLASKATTLQGTKIYLNRSMELTTDTMVILGDHDTHNSSYSNDVLAMNTTNNETGATTIKTSVTLSLNKKIDISLDRYRISLDKVVETVNCKDAKAFAKRIFEECQSQLLKADLSEGKKYYNLRTKEITLTALNKIGKCDKETP
jgi:hypothetical protein